MAAAPTLAIFVPLLMLVVIELSSVARDICLEKVVDEEHRPLFLTAPQIPNVGRLGAIHFANMLFLSIGMDWIIRIIEVNFELKFMTGFLVASIWMILPLLEVEEYDSILKEGETPRSFVAHMAITGLIITMLIVYALAGDALLLVPVSLAFFVAWIGFLTMLESELIDARDDSTRPA